MNIFGEMEKFLYKAVQIGIASVLFLPLVLLGYFGITPNDESSKVLVFQCIMEIIFLFYIYLVLLNKNYLPQKSNLFFAIILFFAVEIAASLAGVNFYRSFFGNLSRADGIVLHLHLLAFFVILVSVFKERVEWLKLFKISVVVSAISSITALLLKLMAIWFPSRWPERLSGTFINPDMFGNYIALSIFLATFVFLTEQNKKLKIFWCFILILDCWTLFFSGTRGAWAGFVAGILFILLSLIYYLWRLGIKPSKRKIALALIILLTIIAIIFCVFKLVSPYHGENYFINRIQSFLSFDIGQSRKILWQTAISSFLERPVLGWGADSFSFIWNKYSKGNGFDNEYEMEADKPHNKILEVASSSGLIGIFAYLLVFSVIFYLIFKNKKFFDIYRQKAGKYLYLVLAAFFLCYFVENLFLFDTVSTYVLFFLVAGFVNNNFVNAPDARANYVNEGKISYLKMASAFAMLIFVALIFYNLNIKTALAGMYLASGDASGIKEPQGALYAYSESLSQNTFYDYDFKLLVLNRINSILETNPPDELKKSFFDVFLKMKPSLYKYMELNDQQKRRLYLYTIKMHKWLYLFNKDPKNLDEMDNIIQRGLSFNKDYPLFYLDVARLKILQNEHQQASEYAQKFYQLTPQDITDEEKMYLALAQSYLEINDLENGLLNAKKVLEIDYVLKKSNGGGPDLPNFTNFVALTYYKLGKAQEALKVYQRAIEIYPNYADIWQRGLEKIATDYKKDEN